MISSILQKAICKVAEVEYKRLKKGMSGQERAAKVERALDELRKLQSGVLPEYDEWVALLYLTWYQFSHVNLAGVILQRLFGDKSPRKPIHIVDFGCGQIPTLFALACYAKKFQESKSMPEISVDYYDTSEPMIGIGKSLWKKFRKISKNRNDSLFHACKSIQFRSMRSHEDIKNIDSYSERILIAMHVVYDKNKKEIENCLKDIKNEFKPTETILTSHRKRTPIARDAMGTKPSTEISFHEIERWPFEYSPQRIHEWRLQLHSRLHLYLSSQIYGEYLKNDVPHIPREPHILRWTSDE